MAVFLAGTGGIEEASHAGKLTVSGDGQLGSAVALVPEQGYLSPVHPPLRRVLPLVVAGLAAILAPAKANAACPLAVSEAFLSARLGDAEDAFGRDPKGFEEATTVAIGLLPCLSTPATPTLAGRVHRLVGLSAFAAQDPTTELRAFAAARSTDPSLTLPLDRFPEGHPLQADWKAIDLAEARVSAVPTPASGETWFDGKQASERPETWPTLFQLVADGKARETTLVLPGEALPAYAIPKVESPSARRRALLLWSALGAGVATTALYAGGAVVADDYRTNPHSDGDLDSLRGTANGLAVASVGTGAVGVGLLAAAAFSGSF